MSVMPSRRPPHPHGLRSPGGRVLLTGSAAHRIGFLGAKPCRRPGSSAEVAFDWPNRKLAPTHHSRRAAIRPAPPHEHLRPCGSSVVKRTTACPCMPDRRAPPSSVTIAAGRLSGLAAGAEQRHRGRRGTSRRRPPDTIDDLHVPAVSRRSSTPMAVPPRCRIEVDGLHDPQPPRNVQLRSRRRPGATLRSRARHGAAGRDNEWRLPCGDPGARQGQREWVDGIMPEGVGQHVTPNSSQDASESPTGRSDRRSSRSQTKTCWCVAHRDRHDAARRRGALDHVSSTCDHLPWHG